MVPRVATLLDDRGRGLAVNIAAGLLALDDDGVVTRGGAHADRRMAAAMDHHAIAAGARADGRAAAAVLRFAARRGPAAARLACRRAAALRIARRRAAAVAIAGTALLARAHAGTRLRVLRLRELDAAGGRTGRGGGSDGDHRCGPEDHCKCSHLFLLRKFLPGRQSGRASAVSARGKIFLDEQMFILARVGGFSGCWGGQRGSKARTTAVFDSTHFSVDSRNENLP